MIKKLSIIFLVFALFFMMTTNAFANTTEGTKQAEKTDAEKLIESVLADADDVNTKELYIKIDSPKNNEKQSEKKYAISGSTEYDDVVIVLARYNESKKIYEPLKNTDDESSWAVGNAKMFSKKIVLEPGINKIKILAYRTSNLKNLEASDIQRHCYTVELVNKTAISSAIEKAKEIGRSLEKTWNSIFNKSSSASE